MVEDLAGATAQRRSTGAKVSMIGDGIASGWHILGQEAVPANCVSVGGLWGLVLTFALEKIQDQTPFPAGFHTMRTTLDIGDEILAATEIAGRRASQDRRSRGPS